MAEPCPLEILRRLLTANPVMALEHERRITIHAQQFIVVRLIEETRPVDACDLALPLRSDINQLTRRAAVDHRLQIRCRELANPSRRLGGIGIHECSILVRPSHLVNHGHRLERRRKQQKANRLRRHGGRTEAACGDETPVGADPRCTG